MTEKNARIERTMFGYEDHGILSYYLTLNYGGSAQGFGGYSLDGYDHKLKRRVCSARGFELLARIMQVVGVDKWEDLPGKLIRVRADQLTVHAIGNALKDDWVYPATFFE